MSPTPQVLDCKPYMRTTYMATYTHLDTRLHLYRCICSTATSLTQIALPLNPGLYPSVVCSTCCRDSAGCAGGLDAGAQKWRFLSLEAWRRKLKS